MYRVAIADDQKLFLETLSDSLSNTGGEVEVLWNTLRSEEVVEKTRAEMPDVLLLDYVFTGANLDGPEVCRLLLKEFPDLPVLMLSAHDDITYIREALSKGAKGYATKNIKTKELMRGIQVMAEGGYFLDQLALCEVIRSLFPTKQPKSILTRRELEVACLYAKGKSTREIGKALFISTDTVESHTSNIRSKTECRSRFEVEEWLKKNDFWDNCR